MARTTTHWANMKAIVVQCVDRPVTKRFRHGAKLAVMGFAIALVWQVASYDAFSIATGTIAGARSPARASLSGGLQEGGEAASRSSAGAATVAVAAAAMASVLAMRLSFAAAVPLRRGDVTKTKVASCTAGGFASSYSGSVSSSSSSFLGSSMAGRVTSGEPASKSGSGCAASSMTMMFERFNEKAIKAVMMAQEESRRLGHNYVGTEMLLVGVVAENTSIAAKVLRKLGVTLKDARKTIEDEIGRGAGMVSVEIPFTPAAKRVLGDAVE